MNPDTVMLVRRISQSKVQEIINAASVQEIATDLLSEFRTQGNTLSTWEIPSMAHKEEAVLAFASIGTSIETLTFLCFEADAIQRAGIRIGKTKGPCPNDALAQTHRDLCDLTYEKLGSLLNIIRAQGMCYTFRIQRTQIIGILKNAILENKFTLSSLNSDLRKDLEPHIVA